MKYPKPFEQLIEDFASLPSIGPKLAERLVLYIFKQEKEFPHNFAEHLQKITELHSCKRCFHISENDHCNICLDTKRDTKQLCIVEDALDVISIERTNTFSGLYHVLGGTMDMMTKKTQTQENTLTIPELLRRVSEEKPEEIILATNPTTEGDLTALYLKRKLSDYPVRVTRLARGLSTGGDIEYADEETLTSALTNRKEFS